MLIPLAKLIETHGLRPGPVLHVGAHIGEEATAYAAYGFRPVWWIEGNEDIIPQLRLNVRPYSDQGVVCALVSDEEKEVTFHIASNGQSSSYLEFGTHAKEHPEVSYVSERRVRTTTLDTLAMKGWIGQAEFVNIDVESVEFDVLRGGKKYLETVQSLYVEVSETEVRIGCARFDEVTGWLRERGFMLKDAVMTGHGWGDAFFVRAQ